MRVAFGQFLGEHPAPADLSVDACFIACVATPWKRACFGLALPPEISNHTTRTDGYLGMSNDEERSEMRYVVRIAEFSESSNL